MEGTISVADAWWSHIKVEDKEHVARKAKEKKGYDVPDTSYPGCTQWWNSLMDLEKQDIYEHCTDAHGMVVKEWTEGKSFSY